MEEQEQLLQTWVGKQVVMETSQGQGGRSGIVATLRQFGPYGVVVSFGYSAGGQEEMRETMFFYPWESVYRLQEPLQEPVPPQPAS
jgi:hypothetical protein